MSAPLRRRPAIGLGYRWPIDAWIRNHLDRFDLLEVTVDACISSAGTRSAICDLARRVPITAHGIGLSIGTDASLDFAYLDLVAKCVDCLRATSYSEHLAFTRVPGRDLANLLPLPRTAATARAIIAKVRQVQSRIRVPFLLENIAYVFDWPNPALSHAEFFNLICGETGAGMLLDVENLYLNACNHNVDAQAFIEALAPDVVDQVHIAGGIAVDAFFLDRTFMADTHDRPIPCGALDLLDHVLARQAPAAIILERDARLDATDEILEDLARIQTRLVEPDSGETTVAATD